MNEQQWNAEEYGRTGRFVAEHADLVLEWLAPQRWERILDLGCGDGALTARIASMRADVTGLDASPDMVAAARARGLRVVQGSGEKLGEQPGFAGAFDAVFSNAALHWMHDQPAVLAGVHAVLKPGGRFVAEMGGFGNIAAIRVAVAAVLARHGIDLVDNANVFYTAEQYRAMLESAGFRVEQIELAPRPTPLKHGMRAWLETFRSGVLGWFNEGDREAALDAMVRLLEPVLRDAEGSWWGDYVRLRWRAIRE